MQSHKSATYIVKPPAGSQGDGMNVFKELKDLPCSIENQEVVIQRYLDKPLLIDGLKFDLRVYVVVVGVDPMQAYLCDEGLARFCTVQYEAPSRANFKNQFMHLTNYSINKMSAHYVRPTE